MDGHLSVAVEVAGRDGDEPRLGDTWYDGEDGGGGDAADVAAREVDGCGRLENIDFAGVAVVETELEALQVAIGVETEGIDGLAVAVFHRLCGDASAGGEGRTAATGCGRRDESAQFAEDQREAGW